MLAKLKCASGSFNLGRSDGHVATDAQRDHHVTTSAQEKRSAKLKKRKPISPVTQQDQLSKPASQPTSSNYGASPSSIPPHSPVLDTKAKDTAAPFSIFETEIRLSEAETILADIPVFRPDRQTQLAFDLRRDSFPTTSLSPSKDASTGINDLPLTSSTSSLPNTILNRSTTDTTRYPPRKLVKKPPSPPSIVAEESGMSPLSVIKRRFTYTSGSPNIPSPIEEELSDVDIRRLSIHATRIPEFSSTSDSSKRVPVTIVDSLPHQKSSSPLRHRMHRRRSSVPATIRESDVNEEFLLEQDEVLSYLHNQLVPPSPATSSQTLTSDGGIPQTPPPATTLLNRQDSIARSTNSFVSSVAAEFPYLFGDSSLPETEPLQPKISTEIYGLGLSAATTTSLPLPHRPTEFPPSPPQSERRPSVDDTSLALLDELASESTSMRSVVDAINRAASPRSSFDYTDSYDYDSIYEDPEDDPLPEPGRPWGKAGHGIETDSDSVYDFTSPILRTGRASQVIDDLTVPPVLSRNDSLASRVTLFEDSDTPISEVLGEKRRPKPSLPPLVITPIAPGQYGPPVQRRQHFRGRGRVSSPISAKFKDKPTPTLVKVVEEEIVEYTPIDEGQEKGWMKQRRISRGGDWVVVEREILSQSAI